jgi:hypothetical protein
LADYEYASPAFTEPHGDQEGAWAAYASDVLRMTFERSPADGSGCSLAAGTTIANEQQGGVDLRPYGWMSGMAKEKVTITLDRAKANLARALVAARSTSETIDLALDRLIEAERLRGDIDAYRRIPPTTPETAIALLADASGLADETDWEALYPERDNNQ